MRITVSKIQNTASDMIRPPATEPDATLAVSSAAVAFDESDLADTCRYVRMQVQGDNVRVTYDGSEPTASNGEIVAVGQSAVFSRDVVLGMKFIRVANDAVVWAQPFNCRAQ